MKHLAVSIALTIATLAGQTVALPDLQKNLSAKLTELRTLNQNAAQRNTELANALTALLEPDHQPSRAAVATLARYTANALAGRVLPAATVNELAASLTAVLRSARTSAPEYRTSIARFEKALTSAGISAATTQATSSKLADVGREVRGPEDLQALPLN